MLTNQMVIRSEHSIAMSLGRIIPYMMEIKTCLKPPTINITTMYYILHRCIRVHPICSHMFIYRYYFVIIHLILLHITLR